MRTVAALLAALAAAATLAACGGGAEPGASKEATLVLDFTPNAVHAGIYAALREGDYQDAGVDLHVQAPSSSTDAPRSCWPRVGRSSPSSTSTISPSRATAACRSSAWRRSSIVPWPR